MYACLQVTMGDVSLFGVIFVLLDVLDGKLARASKAGPTRVGAALDVESDSTAMLFLSLVASRKVCFVFSGGGRGGLRWGRRVWLLTKILAVYHFLLVT